MLYSREAVQRGLWHFVLGKGVTAFCAIALLLALAHQLPKTAFAAYVTLQALILVVGALTSFGLNQVALRYLPEMRSRGHNRPMYALIWRTAGARFGVTGLVFTALVPTLPWFAEPLALVEFLPWVMLYFAVGALRLTSQFMSNAMEALLWPRVSQYSLAVAALLKLGLVLVLASRGWLSLPAVVVVELIAEILVLSLLGTGLWRRQRLDPLAAQGDPDWLPSQRKRMQHFGRWNYVTTLVTQLATTSPYRLLAPVLLGAEKAALLGLVYSLADLLNRFLPARMARLLLRSILVGRLGDRAPTAESTLPPLKLSFRINAVVLAFAVACALGGGSGALAALTGGRYEDLGPLLAAALAILLLDLGRMHHDLMASVHERVKAAVLANLGLGSGIAVAALTASRWGVWALPLGAAVGQVTALALYAVVLRDLRPHALIDARTVGFLALVCSAGASTSWLPPGTPWSVRIALTILAFALAAILIRPVGWSEMRQLRAARAPIAGNQAA